MGTKTFDAVILKEDLHYNQETGVFTWIVSRAGVKKGKIAGSCNRAGYIQIRICGASYYAHRLAWLYVNGEFPADQIDHINRDKSDNRIENLRAVTTHENHKNMPIQSNNTSGFTGVIWQSVNKCWRAVIKVKGRDINLGSFGGGLEGKMLAAAARKNAEELYGFDGNHGRPV